MHGNFEMDSVLHTLQEEIRRIIEEARKDDHILHSGTEAARLASLYSESGLTPDEICDQIIEAAVHAGVTIEMSRPDNGPNSAPAG